MMWLSRKTKVLDSSPLKNGKFKHVLCDQVTWCLALLTISLVSTTSTNDVPIIGGKKNYGSHMIASIHNIARVNCSTGTYFFPKQTASVINKFECNTVYTLINSFAGR